MVGKPTLQNMQTNLRKWPFKVTLL